MAVLASGVPHRLVYTGNTAKLLRNAVPQQFCHPFPDRPKRRQGPLPDDLTKANDLLAQHPDRARELLAKWSEWNKEYVPGRLMGHTDYHKQRDAFFSETVPKPATASGYAPKVKATFR